MIRVVNCSTRLEAMEGYDITTDFAVKIADLWAPDKLEGICQYRLGKMAKYILLYTRHARGEELIVPDDLNKDVLVALRLNSRVAEIEVHTASGFFDEEVIERVGSKDDYDAPTRSKDCLLN